MQLEELRCFVEVVECEGFNRAAQRLGISKSMVSRRIASLEASLGTRLLSRTTRGISPTESGLEFKARCERILTELEEAREAAAQQAGVTGRLRLSAPLSFGILHVAPALAAMMSRHPRLELDVSYSDRKVDLIGERFDAAVRIGSLEDASLVARRIAPSRTVLVASPDYLARRGRPGTPGDLTDHECLIYTGAADPDWVFRLGRRSISIRPQGRVRSDYGDALLQWAEDGLGICHAPTFLVAEALERGRLEAILLDYALPQGSIYVVRPPGPYVPGKVRVLIDTLVERFGGEPVWDRCLMRKGPGG